MADNQRLPANRRRWPRIILKLVGSVVLMLCLGIGAFAVSAGRCQVLPMKTVPSDDPSYRLLHERFPVKTIRVREMTFAYLEAGQGPLVIFLHGFPDTARTWEDAMVRVSEAGFRAVAVFNRGYYPTDLAPDNDYSVRTMADDVLALIGALGEQSAVVVGQDWGASIAYAVANRNPQAVRKLVTLAIPHPAALRAAARVVHCFPHFVVFQFGPLSAAYTRRNNFAYIEYLYHYWSPSWNVPADLINEVKSDFSRPGRLEAALAYYQFAFRDGLDESKTALYQQQTTVPALVFVGEEDTFYRIGAFSGVETAFRGPFSLEVIPGAGHFVHREQPALFAEKLIPFLR